MKIKKSLCIFIHFKNSEKIPFYVKLYVHELTKYFDEVVIVHNEPYYSKNEEIFDENISFAAFPNQGYDFGLFYNYFIKIDPSQYNQIACINDSNILINQLETVFKWGNEQKPDFWGLLDSNEKPWFSTHENNYHIQSHFLVFNENAVDKLVNFFSTTDIDLIFKEKNFVKLRRLVIDKWEIGLSRYLFDCGLKGKSYINCSSFMEINNIRKPSRIGHQYYAELVDAGLPIIKKKVILNRSNGNLFCNKVKWESILKKYGNRQWNIDALINEMKQLRDISGNKFLKFLKKSVANFR